MSKRGRDLKGVISRQKRYSTLAKQEGDYAKKSERRSNKRGLHEMAKDSRREAKIAYGFSKLRKKFAKEAEKKL